MSEIFASIQKIAEELAPELTAVSRDIFEHLAISGCSDYERYLNQCNVIYISFDNQIKEYYDALLIGMPTPLT